MGEKVDRNDEEKILIMLYVKDQYNISGVAYHELTSACKQMPRHYRLKDKIAKLNSQWHLFPTPEGTCGIQQRSREHLTSCLEYMVSCFHKFINTLGYNRMENDAEIV